MKAQVLLPKVFNFPFTYNTNQLSLKIGDFVEVPFGKKTEVGIIWPGKTIDLQNIKIKNINKKYNNFSLDQQLINFMKWFASYNMMPLGLVLKMSIGNKLHLKKKRDNNFIQIKKKLKNLN